jgi:hypothetical protein
MPGKNKTQLTTVQIDLETRRKLGALAQAYRRSLTAQVGMMVEVEYFKLKRLKLLPPFDYAAEERGSAQGEGA